MEELKNEILVFLQNVDFSAEVKREFIKRVEKGKLSIDEDKESHFCVYFAAYDLVNKEVFIGHHKKSGLWLFNGGHIDSGETIDKILKREIKEEWDLDSDNFQIEKIKFLTITDIYNPKKQPCRKHYDLWCFVPVDKNFFKPSNKALLTEFHKYGWKSFDDARELVIGSKETKSAIDFIENNLCKNKK